jgi:hypothetical protein
MNDDEWFPHDVTGVLSCDLTLPRDLNALEVHQRALVIELLAQLAVARLVQVALRLHHLVVGGHADVELALDGVEALLREFARAVEARIASKELRTASAADVTSVAICSSVVLSVASVCCRIRRCRARLAFAALAPSGYLNCIRTFQVGASNVPTLRSASSTPSSEATAARR